MRVICFGDSLTEGIYGGNYVRALATLMPQHTIINAGVGGDTVINLERRLIKDVLEHNPDAVFMMVGGNDAVSAVYPGTRPYYVQAKTIAKGWVSLAEFEQTYRDILVQLQSQQILTWVGLEPTEYSPTLTSAWLEYNDCAQACAARLGIGSIDLQKRLSPPLPPERPPLGLDTIQQIGRRVRAKWADYSAEQSKGGYSFTFDGLHPTPAAAVEIAKQIANFIEI